MGARHGTEIKIRVRVCGRGDDVWRAHNATHVVLIILRIFLAIIMIVRVLRIHTRVYVRATLCAGDFVCTRFSYANERARWCACVHPPRLRRLTESSSSQTSRYIYSNNNGISALSWSYYIYTYVRAFMQCNYNASPPSSVTHFYFTFFSSSFYPRFVPARGSVPGAAGPVSSAIAISNYVFK